MRTTLRSATVLLALAGTLAAAPAPQSPPASSPPAPQPAPIPAASADEAWQARATRFGGDEWITRPSRDAVLGFTLPLEVQEILVQAGDRVKAGTRLIRARDGEVLAGLELQDLKARNDAELRNARAAQELAQSRFDAVEKVMRENAGTPAEYDERRINLDSAKLGVEAAAKRLEEEVLRLKQAHEQAKRYAIEAPFDGVIDQLVAEIGQIVTERDPVVRVVNVDPLWIDVPVRTDDTIRYRLAPGHEAWALIDLPGPPVVLHGKVLYVSQVADPASGTRRARVEVSNPELWPAGTRSCVRFVAPPAGWDDQPAALTSSGGPTK